MLATQNNRNFDKGLILDLSGLDILTTYTYTTITVPPANGAITPSGASSVQYSGQARNLALYVYLATLTGSTITSVTVDIEAAYGDYAQTLADTVAGTPTVVDLTLPKNWAQVLSQVHQGTGPIGVDNAITYAAAPQAATVLVTSTRLAEINAKHLRIGVKANAVGWDDDGEVDILKIFMVAW